jgi:hypothetical protein
MECKRPCYEQAKFDYPGMACFLKSNMKHYNTGMQVVVMIKDQQHPGKYRYKQKPVMYYVPNDPQNSSTVIAYIAPGHSDSYNYMYLLSKRLNGGNNVFSGDHFTMGLRNGEQFDLHYTTYDYTSGTRPVYLYYDLFIDSETKPIDIANKVCKTEINHKYKSYDNTLKERCYFFENLMMYVHNSTYCNTQFPSLFSTTLSYNTGGGKKKSDCKKRSCDKKNKQVGGDKNNEIKEISDVQELDKPFRELIQKLESKIKDIPYLDSVEMHIMNNNKGIITYCLDDKNVESMRISNSGVQEQTGDFMKYYSLPFDFETLEFISIESLVENVNPSIEAKKNDLRVPLDNLVLCDNESLDYKTIIDMNAIPKTQFKTCNNARTSTSSLMSVRVSVKGGKNKKSGKLTKSKDFQPFKLA